MSDLTALRAEVEALRDKAVDRWLKTHMDGLADKVSAYTDVLDLIDKHREGQ